MVVIVLSSLFATAQEVKMDSMVIRHPNGKKLMKFHNMDSINSNLNRLNRIHKTNKFSIFYYTSDGKLVRCRYRLPEKEKDSIL